MEKKSMNPITSNKASRLFMILGGFFVANALIAEFIGIKIFSLEHTIGIDQLNWDIVGGNLLSMDLTTGVLLWPIVFIMTDIINEYYGPKGVKFLSYGAVLLIFYAFLVVFLAIELPAPDWWLASQQEKDLGIDNMQNSYQAIFGQGLWIIVGSLVAFLVGQLVDVFVFHKIKRFTAERALWLRATGSTLVSQLIDSFVVLFIAFYIGQGWDIGLVLGVAFMNYTYKFIVAILLTPVLYFVHTLIDNYLGEELSTKMRKEAMMGQK